MRSNGSRATRGLGLMSELGQKRRFDNRPVTSGLPPTSDIADSASHVGFVPNPEVVRFGVATLCHDVGASPQFHIGRSKK